MKILGNILENFIIILRFIPLVSRGINLTDILIVFCDFQDGNNLLKC